jgi:hypothetical protein
MDRPASSSKLYLRRLIKKPQTRVVALDEQTAYVVGLLLVCARRYRQPVVTGDPEDLRLLDANVKLHTI